jgi:surface antigen
MPSPCGSSGVCISTIHSSVSKQLAVPDTVRASRSLSTVAARLFHRRSSRRRAARVAFIGVNVLILGVIAFFVSQTHTSSLAVPALSSSASADANANPLDQVSSADIALTVARMTALPETTAAANQAQSEAADIAIAASSDDVVTKPQVVATALKSVADIESYTTVAGDSLQSLATKFGVTSSSIAWSNNLTTTATLNPGTKLLIPPINGIIYTVKAGDTPTSLATRFQSNQADIVAFNNAEIGGLTPGEQIVIPNGNMPSGPVASSSASYGASFPWGGSSPVYGDNGYDRGFCTWYVASQIAVPNNWGNASTWAYYAALSGWNVSTTPTVGAIAQTADAAGGEGHVAIVVAVNGSQVEIRDMNNTGDGGGFDSVGQGWVTVGTFEHYITH